MMKHTSSNSGGGVTLRRRAMEPFNADVDAERIDSVVAAAAAAATAPVINASIHSGASSYGAHGIRRRHRRQGNASTGTGDARCRCACSCLAVAVTVARPPTLLRWR